MKAWLEYSLLAIFAGAFVAGTVVLHRASLKQREGVLCREVKVTTASGPELSTPEEIEDYLAYSYGEFLGRPLADLDLAEMERRLRTDGMLTGCEAWTTDDGVLHVSVDQRVPAVQFLSDDGGGFYADAGYFVFPLSTNCSPDVPVVRGQIRKALERDYLVTVMNLVGRMQDSRVWKGRIECFLVGDDGKFAFRLAGSGTKVVIGELEDINRKLRTAEHFVLDIEPRVGPGRYRTVSTEYKGQAVCRTD